MDEGLQSSRRYNPTSGLNTQAHWVRPLDFHCQNLSKSSQETSQCLIAFKYLISDLRVVSNIPSEELSFELIISFRKHLEPLIICLFQKIADPHFNLLTIKSLKGVFELSSRLLQQDDKEGGTIALITFSKALILHGICSNDPSISQILCNHILEIFPVQAFDTPHPKEVYAYLFTHIIEKILSFDKVNLCKLLLLRLNPSITELVLENLRRNNSAALMQTATLVSDEDDSGLLWNRFSNDYETSSFLLTEDLFEEVNALARGELAGKRAHSVANEVTHKMEQLSPDFVVKVARKAKSKDTLLVKSPQITVICALVELFMLAPNFNLLLLGLKSFSHLVTAIVDVKPKVVTPKDFDTLLIK